MCEFTAGLYPEIKEKVRSLAVEISSEKDLEVLVVDIGRSHLKSLEEIILVIGHEERLLEFKYTERVKFSEPEPSLWRTTAESVPWRNWKGWVENMRLFKGCRVQVVRAKIV